jgi:hypothetical protein
MSLLYLLGKFSASLELHNFLGCDLDFFSVLRIAAFAGSSFGNRKRSETYQGNSFTFR